MVADCRLLQARLLDPLDSSKKKLLDSEFVHIIMNCQTSQEVLLHQAALFTPQSGAPPVPLQVLVDPVGLKMAPKDSSNVLIVGGASPYRLSDLSPDLKKDLTAVIPHEISSGSYQIHISRPDGATKDSGTTSIYVADSAGAFADVPVTFVKTSVAAAPPQAASATVKITSASSADGVIAVKFTVPSSIKTDKFTATAKNTDSKKTDTLTATAEGTATEVDIKGCTADASHNVTLSFTPTGSAKAQTETYKPAVKCVAASVVATAPTAPPAPAPPPVKKGT